jgi:hypothetical protein
LAADVFEDEPMLERMRRRAPRSGGFQAAV